MNFITDNQIDFEKWINLFDKSPHRTPFQEPGFFQLFKQNRRLNASVFAIENDGAYTALAVVTLSREPGIKSWFSRRGVIFGGPLLTDRESGDFLLKNITRVIRKKIIYLESRNNNDYTYYSDIFQAHGYQYKPWLNFQIQISNEEYVRKNMSSSRVRQIDKALKSGACWKEAGSINEVKKFYNILNGLYKTQVKKPLLPWVFFESFFFSGSGKIFVVVFQDEIIGGILCPILPGKAIYELYVCGLDSAYKEQHPSVLATWAAIDYALKNDLPMFDFMGAGSPFEEYGVREFKRRFGGVEVENGRFLKIMNPWLYSLGKAGLFLASKLT